ncbi:MAG: hypothetical protein DRG58_11305 [Deltaproteobacteria bacterium]|nr:MAG: hypothetical protein DRG58_11305 [Deltaproteobacteria bacterium]
MNRQKPTENINELTREFLKKGGLSSQRQGFETLWCLTDEKGRGTAREINLRPGLKMVVVDCQPDEGLAMDMEIQDSPLEFNFFVSGMTQSTVIQSRSKKENFVVGKGQTCMGYYRKSCCAIQPIGKEPLCVLNILMLPQLLIALVEDESYRIPADFRSIVEGVGEKTCYRLGAMTASMHMAIHQILNCPYQGLTRRIYLEGLALELIAHLIAEDIQPKAPPALRPADREKISHAREIISRDLENPPTLLELARLVGLSHTKLNRGFREIYGTTVFGYLRKIRLEQAKLLLEEQRMSVTEAAFSVGYNSLPSFSTAFSRHFGLKPIMCIKNSPRTSKGAILL